MLKKCLIVFIILSSFLFGEIIDGANLLKEESKKNLEKRLSFLEENRDLTYIIETQKNEEDFSEFKESKKTIKINILKGEEKVNVKIYFSKDALKLGYSDEIEGLLERVDPLIKSGNYIDLIYEITGEIADINQISNEIIEKNVDEESQGGNNIVKLIVVTTGIILILMVILSILKSRNKITRCDECNLKMTLMAEYEEDNKKYKDYKCTVCGKEITKYTWG